MIEIRDLLNKFNNLLLSEEVKKQSIKKVIEEVIGININSEEIKIKDNIVYLNIKPIYKNEILIYKDKIDSKLQEVLGKKTPSNIR